VVREIRLTAASEVVNDSDLETPLDKKINHVAADESGATGHDRYRQLSLGCWHIYKR